MVSIDLVFMSGVVKLSHSSLTCHLLTKSGIETSDKTNVGPKPGGH